MQRNILTLPIDNYYIVIYYTCVSIYAPKLKEDTPVLTESLIRQLKQVNISKDTEKTKERTREAWYAASKDAQEAIMSLTGITKSSVQRAYKTGSISAKLALAFAQTLNLNPYCLTGESDEQADCSEELIRSFLGDHGYQKLLAELPPAQPVKTRKRRTKASTEKADQVQPAPEPVAAPVTEARDDTPISAPQPAEPVAAPCTPPEPVPISEEIQSYLDTVTEDEIMLFVRAILLRAKAGGIHAEKAKQLKLFLLN